MAHPSESEVAGWAGEDATEAIAVARRRDRAFPVATIADGADRGAQATGFHQRWWRQLDEDWPDRLSETYNEAFTQELMAAKVAVVELHFDTANGNWINIGVVDLEQWEPMFPFDPASSSWVQQDPRSQVGWRRRTLFRKLLGRKKTAEASSGGD